MLTKKKIITVPNGSVDKICQALNCGRTTVYDALRFNNNSTNAQHIRRLAIKVYGGVEHTKVYFS